MLKAFLIFSYLAGIFFAAMAILRSRTPQGATAWVLSLVSFPFISVPLFILFGRNKFEGYNSKRRILDHAVQQKFEELGPIKNEVAPTQEEMKIFSRLIVDKEIPGFTKKNKVKLLINSSETYPEMLHEIANAKRYIVFQFYIVRSDKTGRMFIDALIRKAKEGVRVTFMNDAIGVELPDEIIKKMREAGIETGTFNEATHKGHFQINFRNHRKVLIVDGRVAFMGGLNIGDEYAGLEKEFGHWRDTNIRIEGPSVIAAQLGCAKDWYCIYEKELNADWDITPCESDSTVMVLPTGPADSKHYCLLSFVSLINSAKDRLWIANPYYVPPESLMNAILLAKLRGVDVKILLPSYTDAKFVEHASKVYKRILLKYDIDVYEYTGGFLHQKTMIVDNDFAVVGSVNFDCRSMFINFESSVITNDKDFIASCATMLENDFKSSREADFEYLSNLPLMERITSRGANLLAPIL